jgi:hypothetical protein
VKTSDWFAGSVAKANEYGIVQGMGDGSFMPNKSITREEAMAMIARAMKITGLDTTSSETETASILSQYKDSNSVSAWAKNAAAACTSFKVMQGSYGNLRPQSNITRAETAAVVMRMLQQAELINK